MALSKLVFSARAFYASGFLERPNSSIRLMAFVTELFILIIEIVFLAAPSVDYNSSHNVSRVNRLLKRFGNASRASA